MTERSSFTNKKDFDKSKGIDTLDADAISGLPEEPIDRDSELVSENGQPIDAYPGALHTADLAELEVNEALGNRSHEEI